MKPVKSVTYKDKSWEEFYKPQCLRPSVGQEVEPRFKTPIICHVKKGR